MNAQTIPDDTPWKALAFRLLALAKSDAWRGDLSALAWLVTPGAEIAEVLSPGGSAVVLTFARNVLARLDADAVRTAWGVDA